MAADWVAYRLAYMPAPLLDEWGEKWATLFGQTAQGATDRQTDATLARFPTTAPEDAMAPIAADRRVLIFPPEYAALDAPAGPFVVSMRQRLQEAFSYWDNAGREAGIVVTLARASIAAAVVEDQDVGGAWGHWARFAVYANLDAFYSGFGASPAPATWDVYPWDTFRWDFDPTFGGAIADYLRALILLLRPAHTRCIGLVVERTGYDPILIPIDPTLVFPPLAFPVGLLDSTYFDYYLDAYLG